MKEALGVRDASIELHPREGVLAGHRSTSACSSASWSSEGNMGQFFAFLHCAELTVKNAVGCERAHSPWTFNEKHQSSLRKPA